MTSKQLLELAGAGGKFFSALFRRKDGTLRFINARMGVHRYDKGGKSNADPEKQVVVYDMQEKGHRTITFDRLLKVNGQEVAAE
jgi:uncharacterized protein (UPF0261 family)